jgi:hypothetical protein
MLAGIIFGIGMAVGAVNFLTTSDPDTARYASELCGTTERTHISYTVSESSTNANVGWLSGRTSSNRGTVSASKQYQKRREPPFDEAGGGEAALSRRCCGGRLRWEASPRFGRG